MPNIVYDTTERVSVTLPTALYEKLVKKANENMRSLSSQTAVILKHYFDREERLAQGVHHDKESEREIQD